MSITGKVRETYLLGKEQFKMGHISEWKRISNEKDEVRL